MTQTANAISSSSEAESSSESAPAIKIENVTVSYRAYTRRPSSLKEALIHMISRSSGPGYSKLDALKSVSLDIPKGSVFALVGSNGCGKSTLLKVIAGVLKPTTGHTQVRGEVASLIELGSGFDPDLTAIENIYLNGSLHKKTRAEMSKRIDHILDFSELHDFAYTPIKYYSSGMFARLGFSVAVDVDPDILLIDEILSVGDERFQEKCFAVFDRLINEGKTIVLVTHNMDFILKKAHKAALLQKGQLVYLGDPKETVKLYRESTYKTALV